MMGQSMHNSKEPLNLVSERPKLCWENSTLVMNSLSFQRKKKTNVASTLGVNKHYKKPEGPNWGLQNSLPGPISGKIK
jgi:hypothetical protein